MRSPHAAALPVARRLLTAAARRILPGLGLAAVVGGEALAQAAVDPNVAPRAATLERQGERQLATEMLGRYLAVAVDDGRAWFQLGRFYRLDAADWHARGHTGNPDAVIYLDFAVTALEQASRLMVDSGVVYRAYVEVDRAVVFVEDSGWTSTREQFSWTAAPSLPPYLVELGLNLVRSCPAGGILLTGDDLETAVVWHALLAQRARPDLVTLKPGLYATDARYRARLAAALGVDSALPVQAALAKAAKDRPVCLAPGADAAALPSAEWRPLRLVRVDRDVAAPSDPLSLTSYVEAVQTGPSDWSRATRDVYGAAARWNATLCGGLLRQLEVPPSACGP
jgi:hypothetical protein